MEKIRKFLKSLEPWQGLLAIVSALVVSFFAATAYIKATAQNAVLDEKFLAKLSAQVRPSCIINSKGTIEADLGAMEHLNEVRVIIHPQVYGFELVISPKHHLAYPPQVTALNSDIVATTVERAKMHDWSIAMLPQSTAKTVIADDEMDTNRLYRFRIEILH